MVKKAFDECDLDKSGQLDSKEVYAAVLLFYLKVKSIAPLAKPPDARHVHELVMKTGDSGTADDDRKKVNFHEFKKLINVLAANLGSRIGLSMVIQFGLAPLFAATCTKLISSFLQSSTGRKALASLPGKLQNLPLALRHMNSQLLCNCFCGFTIPALSKLVDALSLKTVS